MLRAPRIETNGSFATFVRGTEPRSHSISRLAPPRTLTAPGIKFVIDRHRVHRVSRCAALAASLALVGVAHEPVTAHVAPAASPRCEYLPTGPELPQVGTTPPRVAYDPRLGVVTVVLHLVRGADLKRRFPYFLSTPGRQPVRMSIEGPISDADAARALNVKSSDVLGEYWTLKGALPSPVPFAVYYDEVWTGTETTSDRPCSSVIRRLVASVAEGPQLKNERGPSGMLPSIRLFQPVSTQPLASIGVPPPHRLRALDPESSVRTVVTYRAAPTRPLSEEAVTSTLDTQRGFDIALTTSGPAAADLEYRYVVGRAHRDDEFVLERFSWAVGDAVAAAKTIRSRGSAHADGSRTIRLDAGFGRFVTVRITSNSSGGQIQITDATR